MILESRRRVLYWHDVLQWKGIASVCFIALTLLQVTAKMEQCFVAASYICKIVHYHYHCAVGKPLLSQS